MLRKSSFPTAEAISIVEIIDRHGGVQAVFMWTIGILTFFRHVIVDSLT